MRIICHRGNLNGPDIFKENHPDQIDKCIRLGYDAEIDLWYIDSKYYLGHDSGIYEVDFTFLYTRKHCLWIHCKNREIVEHFHRIDANEVFNFFWHEEDTCAITSKGFMWTYPGKEKNIYSNEVVLNFSENVDFDFYKEKGIYAICVDYVDQKGLK